MDGRHRLGLAVQMSTQTHFDRSILVLSESSRELGQSKNNEMGNYTADQDNYKLLVVHLSLYWQRCLEAVNNNI